MFTAYFPVSTQRINDQPLIYLDSAATTQKPQVVIDVMTDYLVNPVANVHRAHYDLAVSHTHAFEEARRGVAQWMNAAHAHEIIWTSGTTESINRVSQTLGDDFLQKGDEILITAVEHHANLVPWQQLAKRYAATLVIAPVTADLELDLQGFQRLLSQKTRIVAMAHVSNVTGKINPIAQMIQMAKQVGALTLVDGAQAVAHLPIDVQALGCDFYAFSGHKMYGPTGIGVLYGQTKRLQQLDPWLYGGEMIEKVTYTQTHFAQLPFKLEAGTPNIEGVIGLHAAVKFLQNLDHRQCWLYEQQLTNTLLTQLKQVPGVNIFGSLDNRIGVVSFVLENIHAFDISTLLDMQGIAVRIGTHCAMPFVHSLGVSETIRVSLGLHNTLEDIHRLIAALQDARTFLI